MTKTPNTRPEQITDKNGKVTTVHKSSGKKASETSGSRAASIPLPPVVIERLGLGRISDFTKSVTMRAQQFGDPLGTLKTVHEAAVNALVAMRRAQIENGILMHDPEIRTIKMTVDDDSNFKFDGAYNWEGKRIADDSEFLPVVSVDLARYMTGKRQPAAMDIHIHPATVGPILELDELPIEDPSYGEIHDMIKVTESLIKDETRKKFESELRAVNPYIDGVEYEAEFDTDPGNGRWYKVKVTALHMFGKSAPIDGKGADGKRIAEIIENTNGNDLVQESAVGAKGTIMFSTNEQR